jgi:predicted dehydrogenase
MSCKWGLLGCANIANKNVRAIQLSENSELVAIASRSIEKAKAFASDNGLKDAKLYSSYEELLSDPNVQCIYMPLPTALHLEWAVKVAKARKHLLIEKPAALNADQLSEIIMACRSNNVLFMDGVMFMHHDRLHLLRNCLQDPFAGEVMRVNSSFSFNGSNNGFIGSNIRTNPAGDPLGALGDLGWYCIRLGLIAFSMGKDEEHIVMPTTCTSRCMAWSEDTVPLECDAVVKFDDMGNTKELRFSASFLLPFQQRFEILSVGKLKGTADRVTLTLTISLTLTLTVTT